MSKHSDFGPSSLARRDLCPASYYAEKDLPETTSEDAAAGTAMHEEIADAIRAMESTGVVCDGGKEYIGKACWMVIDCKNDLLGEDRDPSDMLAMVEERLEYRYLGKILFFGTADVAIVNGGQGCIIDWKTGHRDVEDASDNLQGAAYAIALAQRYHLSRVLVVFCNTTTGTVTRAWFGMENLREAARQIIGIITRCQDPTSRHNPGEEACRYCKARIHGTCPAVTRSVVATSAVSLPSIVDMTDSQLAHLLSLCDQAQDVREVARAEMLRRIEDAGAPVAGYTVRRTQGGLKARPSDEFRAALLTDGVSANAISGAMSISVTAVQEAWVNMRLTRDGGTKKDAVAEFERRFAGYLERKTPGKQLVRSKQ